MCRFAMTRLPEPGTSARVVAERSVSRALQPLRRLSGCEAVAIRLLSSDRDFPYVAADGFSDGHLAAESSLLSGRDTTAAAAAGAPNCGVRVDCLCGTVLCGLTDESSGLFTRGGAFVARDTAAIGPEALKALGYGCRIRGTCIEEGYRTMAMLPIKTPGGEVVGLIQCNDKRPSALSDEVLGMLETLADAIGKSVASAYRQAAAASAKSADAGPSSCMYERASPRPTPTSLSLGDVEDIVPFLQTKQLGHYAAVLANEKVRSTADLAALSKNDLLSMDISAVSARSILKSLDGLAQKNLFLRGVRLGKQIGQGSAGTVFRAKYKKYQVAVKVARETDDSEMLAKEAAILSRLLHPNIVLFLGLTSEIKPVGIVTELAKGCLGDLLRSGVIPKGSDYLLHFASDIAAGMNYLSAQTAALAAGVAYLLLRCRRGSSGDPEPRARPLVPTGGARDASGEHAMRMVNVALHFAHFCRRCADRGVAPAERWLWKATLAEAGRWLAVPLSGREAGAKYRGCVQALRITAKHVLGCAAGSAAYDEDAEEERPFGRLQGAMEAVAAEVVGPGAGISCMFAGEASREFFEGIGGAQLWAAMLGRLISKTPQQVRAETMAVANALKDLGLVGAK
eukprot:m51a1_g5752 putative pas domain s-box (625) ;mRNA; r:1190717-1194468